MIIKPIDVVCYDEDDSYLVVAADKGTATFSDIANSIAIEYGFWLGDAFASGGSFGYDHKKMGITARGAWESIKRHFYEMNRDLESNFTVVGIGDMAGDVFGNGMLLSDHIQLVAAFNHLHIFIDPFPDAAISFQERKRLFHLPRSNWSDYNAKLISSGGGVFSRSAKFIQVSPEMKQVFKIKQDSIEPNELIRAILKAPVDLLWSAGIGTFVKASTETHGEVGDRSNDAIRVNADQLHCKVVGEGGNLGLTQLARVEYALNGGLVYTDFIDNSAGVNCSDKEVNIKILLNGIVAAGDLTEKQRNELLEEMTQEVASLVLRNNFTQTRAISVAAAQAAGAIDLHSRYISELERSGKLDRELEYLPTEKTLLEYKLKGHGLTRPEIAVLLSYSKNLLKEQILASNIPEESFLNKILVHYFPKPLQQSFKNQMQQHPLKREIIATKLSNLIINEMGFTFIYRLQYETGAFVPAIVKAYLIAREVIGLESIWSDIEALGATITAQIQAEMMMLYMRLLRRLTRWFLKDEWSRKDIGEAIKRYAVGIEAFKKCLPEEYSERTRRHYQERLEQYTALNIPPSLAHELTLTPSLFSAADIIQVSQEMKVSVARVTEIYFGIGEFLDLDWLRSQIIVHITENHWESLSREALRDDLDWQQKHLTADILKHYCQEKSFKLCIKKWTQRHAMLIERWRRILADLRAAPNLTYTMFLVATRELLELTQATPQEVA